ncbi:hypothetical protein KQX54_007210, partial [Cotesia glomerata]
VCSIDHAVKYKVLDAGCRGLRGKKRKSFYGATRKQKCPDCGKRDTEPRTIDES